MFSKALHMSVLTVIRNEVGQVVSLGQVVFVDAALLLPDN